MKYDLEKLKELNPLASVVQETGGFELYVKEAGDRWLFCAADPDLKIDQEAGRWYRRAENGDVIAWLMDFYGWPFVKAAEYLEARAKRPQAERCQVRISAGQAVPVEAGAPVLASPSAWPPGHNFERGWYRIGAQAWGYQDPLGDIQDPHLKQALELLQGVSRRIIDDLALTGKSHIGDIFQFLAWMPRNYVRAVGWVEFCAGCYQDFGSWQDEYYYPLDELEGRVLFEDGAYCAACVAKYKRWHKGRAHLLAYMAEHGLIYDKDGNFL